MRPEERAERLRNTQHVLALQGFIGVEDAYRSADRYWLAHIDQSRPANEINGPRKEFVIQYTKA